MKSIWKFILSNVDTLIAILVSLLATIVGIFGGNQFFLLSGIAATLAILAISLIRDRANRETLSDQILTLQRNLPDHPSAMAFFRQFPDLDPFFRQAMQIDICGVTLTNTINREYPILRDRLEAGAKLRFLLIDPTSAAIEMSIQRRENSKDVEYFPRRVESTLSDLTYLFKYNNDLKLNRKRTSKTGSISVRLLPYAPSFGMINLDTTKKHGIICVEIYAHKYGFKNQPSFDLTPEHDKAWYSYFSEQFEQMWNSARPWDPSPYLQKIQFEK